MSAGFKSRTLLLVRKFDVICSGRMDPNVDMTVALFIEIEEDVSFRLGEVETSSSRFSLTLLTSEKEAALRRRLADKVRSGWTLLSPELLQPARITSATDTVNTYNVSFFIIFQTSPSSSPTVSNSRITDCRSFLR